jgi:hypothetical protein
MSLVRENAVSVPLLVLVNAAKIAFPKMNKLCVLKTFTRSFMSLLG